eukprot:gene11279-12459_t
MVAVKNLPYILLITLCMETAFSDAQINLFISNKQSKQLIGIESEISYIRAGNENRNAIKYNLPIPHDVHQVVFTWQNFLGGFHLQESELVPIKPLQTVIYTLNVSSGNTKILQQPTINISTSGNIPNKLTNFAISLKCSSKYEGDVPVFLALKLTDFNETTATHHQRNLNFKFIKVCKKGFSKFAKQSDEGTPSKVTKTTNEDETSINQTSVFYIAVGVACSTILIIAIAVATLHVQSMPKNTENAKMLKDIASQSDIASQGPSLAARISNPVGTLNLQIEKQKKDVRARLKDIEVSRQLVTLGNVVQEGAFGRVYVGTLLSSESGEEQKVFIKTVTDQASPEQVNLFLTESILLKKANHRNLLPTMHACIEDGFSPLVILPYMNRGNLKNYMRLSRTAEPLSKTLTTRDIVFMAIQIARGLQYLVKRRIFHKDVATRNCVTDEEYRVKITDTALARDFFPGDYHCLGDNENRPVRWMAVESLEFNTYSPASVVWSYGVLLWELTTLAQTPYANVDPFEMLRYLKAGFRLPQPPNCPDDLFTVMACCWALAAEERPHFNQVVVCLEGFYSTLNAFI